MEETQTRSETIKEMNNTTETNLPAVVASLEMLTMKDVSNEVLNRRCSLRPRKRPCSEKKIHNNRKEMEEVETRGIKEIYTSRSVKRKLNSLETIYEEKDDANEGIIYMSAKRYKRMIQFQEKPTDSKIKKRRAKIKRVFGSKISFRRKCTSMQVLLEKLNGIRAEASSKIENETK
ncbi:uncharacterized protein LOC108623462 [Ceratina calcarata]|uniref:Uncharacterized protein LOC108623462 n=1 Tax=Ceratina calcarata TaxID=156304 RepID=A0AAJ7W9I1_9HYME|nr:uncharacterized protein LOC108623462 [Ceratina calcarata]XP_017877474.1 uncharacterized protein LOC108623462 [Ceratina calcarata]XP_026668090.1 uncharacterized protein LOC108623462 [Ceratina calcarata]